MQFTQTLFAALFAASSVVAAPVQSMSAGESWTCVGVKQVCDGGDNTCTWTWNVNNTPINFQTKRNGNTPASQSNGGPQNFGSYTLTSGWSGQFGPGNGFTTFALVDNSRRVIAYPSYSDKDVAGGRTVSPDRSFPVQNL